MDFVVKEIKPVLSIKELAETFSVSERTVYREIDAGLPYIVVGKNKRFLYQEALHWFRNKK